ncbi:MAG: hypothetical protein OXR72_09090 [Gemmatimonadota bacterium]|nr:hypothetical protein [Gemmatimonadota bacterium]
MDSRKRAFALALAVVTILVSAVPAQAQQKTKDFLYSKKLYGALSLGASIWFFTEAHASRKDANDAYEQYRTATSAQTAGDLYNESKSDDTRAAIMLGLGLGTLAYSVHLFLSDEGEELPPPEKKANLVELKGIGVAVNGDLKTRGVRLNLNKAF